MRALPLLLVLIACGSSGRAPFTEPSPPGETTDGTEPAEKEPTRTGSGSSTSHRDAGSSAPAPTAVDPEAIGPFDVDTQSGTKNTVAMQAFVPKTDGPSPVVVFAHGFQLAPSQYDKPLRHLASYGYVVVTADFKASLTGGNDNHAQAASLLAGLDWAAEELRADADHAGMSGHSLGGKLALLAATKDERVKASIVLDPVDGNGVVVADLLPDLRIPTAFLGETLDSSSSGFGQACAPSNANYETFFANANAPSLAVTIAGASHMSFIDDPSSCGVACSFCKSASTPASEVAKISRGFLVAFYERHLRGRTEYDAYLAHETSRVTVETR